MFLPLPISVRRSYERVCQEKNTVPWAGSQKYFPAFRTSERCSRFEAPRSVYVAAQGGVQCVWWIGKFTQADADIRSFVEHIGLAVQGLLCRLGGQKQSSVLLPDRSIHGHLSKCTINFFCSHIAFDRIKHSRKVSECGSVIALFKSIGGDARKFQYCKLPK